MNKNTLSQLIILFLFTPLLSISQGFGFNKVLKNAPKSNTTFCIPNTKEHQLLLFQEEVTIKYSSENWLFITTTPTWINEKIQTKELSSFHFEFAPPVALNDTARGHHFVDAVHAGSGGLSSAYTGKNVIIGVVDTGLDYNHPDFLDANGKTRVLRYWDQGLTGTNPPTPYNYGQEWDSTDINNGTITSMDATAHGTTVAGCAAGNGFANGTNKGMAPDANLVIIETDFSLPNWTLTIADACDYIFDIADQYNMPAVINLSLGSYLGSHDGNDPASEYMESLIEAQAGRIIVGAAGNSGQWDKYHLHGSATNDTTFTWFKSNPSNQISPNGIYFDYWTDTLSAQTIDFAFGADSPGPSYHFSGHSNFHNSYDNFSTSPLYDTIYNQNGDRLATIETYREIQGPNYHMEVLFTNVDSLSHLYRFMTKGSGDYDLWSGLTLQLNEIVGTNLPSVAEMPAIIHYQTPDSLQSIVSSWNCSEKIISVANSRNRANHVDKNGNLYVPFPSSVGEISPNSSRGPSRLGLTKPDITASGDVSLSAGPLNLLNDMAAWNVVDSGGWHVRNGGTSMASPVVAGIAALYLEKCRFGTYSAFKTLLTSTAYSDVFTGTIPNNSYGFGKANALDLLLATAEEPTPTVTSSNFLLTSSTAINYQWVKDSVDIFGATNQTFIPFSADGYYQVYVVSSDGCPAYSTPLFAVAGIDELEKELMRIFPNPSNGSFQIQSEIEISGIEAVDLSGRTMKIEKLYNNNYVINNGVSGQYLLNIQTERGPIQLKIVIK